MIQILGGAESRWKHKVKEIMAVVMFYSRSGQLENLK